MSRECRPRPTSTNLVTQHRCTGQPSKLKTSMSRLKEDSRRSRTGTPLVFHKRNSIQVGGRRRGKGGGGGGVRLQAPTVVSEKGATYTTSTRGSARSHIRAIWAFSRTWARGRLSRCDAVRLAEGRCTTTWRFWWMVVQFLQQRHLESAAYSTSVRVKRQHISVASGGKVMRKLAAGLPHLLLQCATQGACRLACALSMQRDALQGCPTWPASAADA